MTKTMEGIRVLEVAEHTFVPAASAVLADWGADVIKVEHAVRGDAMRGLGRSGVLDLSKGVHVVLRAERLPVTPKQNHIVLSNGK